MWSGAPIPPDFERKTKNLSADFRKRLKEFYQGAEFPNDIFENKAQIPANFKFLLPDQYYEEVYRKDFNKKPVNSSFDNSITFLKNSWGKLKKYFTS